MVSRTTPRAEFSLIRTYPAVPYFHKSVDSREAKIFAEMSSLKRVLDDIDDRDIAELTFKTGIGHMAAPFRPELLKVQQCLCPELGLLITRDSKRRRRTFDRLAISTRYLEKVWTVIAWLATSISILTFQADTALPRLQRTVPRNRFQSIVLACGHISFMNLGIVSRLDSALNACTNGLYHMRQRTQMPCQEHLSRVLSQ
ncbi:unnamed protein product [Dracunculus medinensis]|uniref:Uncharacterized protein n=1 Tax=Dracunculus medinensis TaxID=318479 RepID=A0A0N4UI62_DRAME|nr:unnamed protein product [Dracunculus medinensis]